MIDEGALADNPLEDIGLLTRPEENVALIMKAGKIYKNMLGEGATR